MNSIDPDIFAVHYRWIILALLWLLYTVFGMVARSIFPLVTPILDDLHLSYSQMGIILGSWQLTYILVALVAGTILDRWGVYKSIFAGAIIIGLSAALRYLAEGIVKGDEYISHRFPLEKIGEALETARSSAEAIKVMVMP